jgi:hypothetical protein
VKNTIDRTRKNFVQWPRFGAERVGVLILEPDAIGKGCQRSPSKTTHPDQWAGSLLPEPRDPFKTNWYQVLKPIGPPEARLGTMARKAQGSRRTIRV